METLVTPFAPVNAPISGLDGNLVSSLEITSSFNPETDYVVYSINRRSNNSQVVFYDYTDYIAIANPFNANSTDEIDIDPVNDLTKRGFDNGSYTVSYNFYRPQISSSLTNRSYFIKTISPERNIISLATNTIPDVELANIIPQFISNLNSAPYFQGFLVNINTSSFWANNITFNTSVTPFEILVNLYDPLPNSIQVKDQLWITTQVANPLGFTIDFKQTYGTPTPDSSDISGPNFDIPLKDQINNSSNYTNYNQIFSTGFLSSYDQINSILNEKSLEINIDYTQFENFIHFSSAKSEL